MSDWQGLPRPYVLIQRRAGDWTPNKNWPDESWNELIQLLSGVGTIIEVGAVDETSCPSGLVHYIDLRGKTTLQELIACVAAADVLVGPDSGPMHIAAAVGTPAVVILGGYDLRENIAYSGNKILDTRIHCSPCWLRSPCPIEQQCLREVLPKNVEKAVREVLREEAAVQVPSV
jgi:heptosyltransferase-1